MFGDGMVEKAEYVKQGGLSSRKDGVDAPKAWALVRQDSECS